MAIQVPARNGGTLTRPAKGETMNPNGRPRKLVGDVLKEMQNKGITPVTPQQVKDIYLSLVNNTDEDFKQLLNDPKQPMLVKIVVKSMIKGNGVEVIEKMFDRSIGRAIAKTEISGVDGGPIVVEEKNIDVTKFLNAIDNEETN